MPDDLFYLVIWATLLCTTAGPVAVGLLDKALERKGGMLPPTWGPQASEPARVQPDNSPQSETAPVREAGSNAAATLGPVKVAKKAAKAGKESHAAVPQRL